MREKQSQIRIKMSLENIENMTLNWQNDIVAMIVQLTPNQED